MQLPPCLHLRHAKGMDIVAQSEVAAMHLISVTLTKETGFGRRL